MGNLDGAAADARFEVAAGVAYDGSSTLFVADSDDALRTVDVTSGVVRTLARGLEGPWSIGFDATTQTVYVAERRGRVGRMNSCRLVKITESLQNVS
jgi:DNA-binding beta-propeller fold protein YncE